MHNGDINIKLYTHVRDVCVIISIAVFNFRAYKSVCVCAFV